MFGTRNSGSCKVELNTNTGRMHITASIMYNDAIRKMPNVRFEKRRGIWIAPIIRRNVEAMRNHLMKMPNVIIDANVASRMDECINSVAVPRKENFPDWYEFKTKPFIYQRAALDYAWSMELMAFFMEMGTGKSKTAIDLSCARFKAGLINSMVIFCPVPLRTNWVHEIRTHATVKTAMFVVDTTSSSFNRRSEEFLKYEAPDNTMKIAIVGIESFSQGLEKGKAYSFMARYVRTHNSQQVVDESHKIKGHDATRSINIEYLGRQDRFKLIMTGSPISQGPTDLFQQFQYLSPDIIGLGDFMSFRNRYCVMGGFQNKIIEGYDNIDELMEIIKPYVYTITKEEALPHLPPKTYTTTEVTLSKDQAKVYKEIKDKKRSDISELVAKCRGLEDAQLEEQIEIVCDNVLSAYTSLQQVVAGYMAYWVVDEDGRRHRKHDTIIEHNRNPKIIELIDILESNQNRPAIIWAKFNHEIDAIVEALSEKYGADKVAQYHGRMDKNDRDIEKERFTSGKADYFVSNQATGGTGLTLNRASLTVYLSNDFVLINRMQSEDRNHRIGQTNAVLYVDIVAKGTVDETILTSIRSKMDLANFVRDTLRDNPAKVVDLIQ
ncbi:DNA helicase [Providencia phage Kokobel2]|nr:DNA helicase [Providencia phage Kokobel2]